MNPPLSWGSMLKLPSQMRWQFQVLFFLCLLVLTTQTLPLLFAQLSGPSHQTPRRTPVVLVATERVLNSDGSPPCESKNSKFSSITPLVEKLQTPSSLGGPLSQGPGGSPDVSVAPAAHPLKNVSKTSIPHPSSSSVIPVPAPRAAGLLSFA